MGGKEKALTTQNQSEPLESGKTGNKEAQNRTKDKLLGRKIAWEKKAAFTILIEVPRNLSTAVDVAISFRFENLPNHLDTLRVTLTR